MYNEPKDFKLEKDKKMLSQTKQEKCQKRARKRKKKSKLLKKKGSKDCM